MLTWRLGCGRAGSQRTIEADVEALAGLMSSSGPKSAMGQGELEWTLKALRPWGPGGPQAASPNEGRTQDDIVGWMMMMEDVLVQQLPGPRTGDARREPDVVPERLEAAVRDGFGRESVVRIPRTFLCPLPADHCQLGKGRGAQSKLMWHRCCGRGRIDPATFKGLRPRWGWASSSVVSWSKACGTSILLRLERGAVKHC